MGELTPGAFAAASRLSPKALMIYAESGLLVPARTDPFTGYRYYAASQLERARLIGAPRRVGMPLLKGDTASLRTGFDGLASVLAHCPGNGGAVDGVVDGFVNGLPLEAPCDAVTVRYRSR